MELKVPVMVKVISVLNILLQLKNCDTDKVKMTLSMDEAMDLVMATGFPNPLQMLRMADA